MSIREVIRQLGGPCHVAALFGVTTAAVTNWSMRNDVPAAHRLRLWMLVTERGVDWSPPEVTGFDLIKRAA